MISPPPLPNSVAVTQKHKSCLFVILSYWGKLFYSLKCLYKRSHLCKRKRKLSKYFFAVACKKYVCVAVTNYVLQSKKVIKYVNENDFILC